MPKITYVEFNGTEHVVDVPVGHTIMEGAVKNMIPGIDGDCGGACACSTCHVYVDAAWTEQIGKPEGMEVDMLDFAHDVKDNSRLGCQIKVSEEHEGLKVAMPESQF